MSAINFGPTQDVSSATQDQNTCATIQVAGSTDENAGAPEGFAAAPDGNTSATVRVAGSPDGNAGISAGRAVNTVRIEAFLMETSALLPVLPPLLLEILAFPTVLAALLMEEPAIRSASKHFPWKQR